MFLAAAGAEPRQVAELEGYAGYPVWSEAARRFLLDVGDEVLAFATDGQPFALPGPMTDLPVAARGGDLWAWVGPEYYDLYVGQVNNPPRLVYAGYISTPLWSPDGDTLLFHGDGMLYAARGPEFRPVAVTNVLELSGEGYMEWVNP